VRDDKIKVTSLGWLKTREDTALLANVLVRVSSALEAEGIEAAHFFVSTGERRRAGACRPFGARLNAAG
jgi:hypothetical protein